MLKLLEPPNEKLDFLYRFAELVSQLPDDEKYDDWVVLVGDAMRLLLSLEERRYHNSALCKIVVFNSLKTEDVKKKGTPSV